MNVLLSANLSHPHRLLGVCALALVLGVSHPALGISFTELQSQLQTIAATAQGRVGCAVELLETQEEVSWHGQDRFPMQSVYKLPIALLVLRQVDAGKLHLDQRVAVTPQDIVPKPQHSPLRDAYPAGTELSVSNLLAYTVSESDGTACDVCLRLLGGTAAAQQALCNFGVTNVVIATTEKEMGAHETAQYRSWATPEGMNHVLRLVQEGRGLSPASHALLLRLLTDTATGPHRLKGLLPAGTPVAHKTGSSGTSNRLTRATNDAGLITLPDGRHLAISVFVSDSTADEATREAVIAKLARAAWDYWSPPAR